MAETSKPIAEAKPAAEAEREVIDLSASKSDDDDVGGASALESAHITPDRPTKRVRVSRRLEALRSQQEKEQKLSPAEESGIRAKSGRGAAKAAFARRAGKQGGIQDLGDDSDDTPEYEGTNTNGYFEVDKILDRRTRKYGSESAGLRQVVEYRK